MPTLPFSKLGLLREKSGVPVVEELPISDPWPTTRSVFDAGAHYDHEAEAHLDYAAELETPNLVLEVDGEEYMVIDREKHYYLPHVALRLRRTRAGG